MHLCAQIIETYEGLWHKRCREIMPEIIEARAHQYLLGELLGEFKGKSPPSCNEVCYAFVLSLFISINFGVLTHLCIEKLAEELLLHHLSPDYRIL